MNRAGIALVASLLFAAGCLNAHVGSPLAGPVPCTQDEVFRTYGLPDSTEHEGEILVYRFVRARAKGSSVGASWNGIGLTVGCTQSGAHTIEVRMDSAGRVLAIDEVGHTDGLKDRLWPFGD